MTTKPIHAVFLLAALTGFCSFLPVPLYADATITVINLDGPNEGFNDSTPITPTGGNPGRTLGEARFLAFQKAADIWGTMLESSVEIRVAANFDSLGGTANAATLGAAGPVTVFRDFAGAPRSETWYVSAHANALAGIDLDNGDLDDISAVFNSDVDGDIVLGPTSWYYGFDGNPPSGDIDFLTTLLHEIGHGLGFLSLVELETGSKLQGLDDAYSVYLEHHGASPSDYPSMTNSQRVTASKAGPNLHWTGPNVLAAASSLSSGVGAGGHVQMYAPNPQEPGSSVSHYSTSLFPDELMEPFYAGPDHQLALTLALFADLGWPVGGSDRDGDGIEDDSDNCPDDFNSDQADNDNDQVGDACDNCPANFNDDQTDSDNDQLGDVCDNCPDHPNLNQEDLDGDDVGDVCDNCPEDFNPDQTDTDQDGIGDSCQGGGTEESSDLSSDETELPSSGLSTQAETQGDSTQESGGTESTDISEQSDLTGTTDVSGESDATSTDIIEDLEEACGCTTTSHTHSSGSMKGEGIVWFSMLFGIWGCWQINRRRKMPAKQG